MKIPAQSEAAITRGVRAILQQLGIFHWKVHQGLGSTPGIPDICGIWQGKFLAIEIKTAKGKLSPQQERKIAEITAHGGLAFVVRSIDDLIEALGVEDRFLFSRKR